MSLQLWVFCLQVQRVTSALRVELTVSGIKRMDKGNTNWDLDCVFHLDVLEIGWHGRLVWKVPLPSTAICRSAQSCIIIIIIRIHVSHSPLYCLVKVILRTNFQTSKVHPYESLVQSFFITSGIFLPWKVLAWGAVSLNAISYKRHGAQSKHPPPKAVFQVIKDQWPVFYDTGVCVRELCGREKSAQELFFVHNIPPFSRGIDNAKSADSSSVVCSCSW